MKYTAGLIFLATILFACQPKVEKNEVVIAEVGDITLSADDLEAMLPSGVSGEDSAELAEKFIQNWVREQVVYAYAMANLPEEDIDFNDEIESYRRSLLTFALENHIVRQHLDTVVSEGEIARYYEENQENFLLKDYIVRVRFCILDSLVEVGDEFEELFTSEDPEDLVLFEQFCVENGAAYFIDDEQWLYFSDLLEEVPIETYNIEQFLKKSKTVSFRANRKQYFLKVVDYKFKDNVSPLSLQREKIRNLILNRRKLDLLSKMHSDLYQEAVRKNQIHIYQE